MDTVCILMDMNKTPEADGRRRAPFPQKKLKSDVKDLVERAEAAQLAGVTERTITRWASLGYLTKYENARGCVAFSRRQVKAMNRYEAADS
jgi:hypothetical protein